MDERRKKVGKRIQRARRAAGHKSAKAFAAVLGISPTSVARAEAGWDTTGAGVYSDIEVGLRWPEEVIKRYLESGDETFLDLMPIRSDAVADLPAPRPPGPPSGEFSAEQRARWRSMTINEIFERGREIREMFNADEQLRYLNAALGEKERQRSEAESTEDSPL